MSQGICDNPTGPQSQPQDPIPAVEKQVPPGKPFLLRGTPPLWRGRDRAGRAVTEPAACPLGTAGAPGRSRGQAGRGPPGLQDRTQRRPTPASPARRSPRKRPGMGRGRRGDLSSALCASRARGAASRCPGSPVLLALGVPGVWTPWSPSCRGCSGAIRGAPISQVPFSSPSSASPDLWARFCRSSYGGTPSSCTHGTLGPLVHPS